MAHAITTPAGPSRSPDTRGDDGLDDSVADHAHTSGVPLGEHDHGVAVDGDARRLVERGSGDRSVNIVGDARPRNRGNFARLGVGERIGSCSSACAFFEMRYAQSANESMFVVCLNGKVDSR